MRKLYFLSIIFFFFIVFPPERVPAGEQPQGKAKTLDELVQRYDVSSCKQCHQEIYEQWEGSIHSRSLVGTSRTANAFGAFIKNIVHGPWKFSGIDRMEDLKVEHVMQCLECHLPQVREATDEVAQELARAALNGDEATLGKLGINCIVCHRDKAIIHQWVDGPPEKDSLYGVKVHGHDDQRFKTVKKSPVIREAIFCGQCHGEGPLFNYPNPVQCPTLYGSYMHAYIPAGGGKTCQECHMNKGHLMSSYRDPDQTKEAVRVEVETMSYYFHPKAFEWIPEAVVRVKLTNNAGHRIPDG